MEVLESLMTYLNENFAPVELVFIGILGEAIFFLVFAKALLFIARKLRLISQKKYQESIVLKASKRKRKQLIYSSLSVAAVIMMLMIGYRISWQQGNDVKQWQRGTIGHLTLEADKQIESYVREQDIRDLCVGIIKEEQTYSTCLSQSPDEDKFELDGSAIFEIGSISKTFTYAAMLVVLDRHNVKLDSSIGPFLPRQIAKKNPALARVTWHQLANHTSGLSRMPNDWNWTTVSTQLEFLSFGDASKDFTTDYVYQYLASAQLVKGQGPSYSNLAVGLLGLLLSDLEHKSYAQLIDDYVVSPLNLTTTQTGDFIDAENAVEGYGKYRRMGNIVISTKSQQWTFSDALAGAGAIDSSLNDMMVFLDDRMQAYQQAVFQQAEYMVSSKKSSAKVNLGWIVSSLSPELNTSMVFHDGATGGFRSFIGFDESSETGVVILANGTRGVIPLGKDILTLLADKSVASAQTARSIAIH